MFKTRLQNVMGKVDGFITQLQAGIDDTKQARHNKTDEIIKLNTDVANMDVEIEAGQKLLNNLTKLKG